MKTYLLHSWIVAFLLLSLSLITVSEKAGPVAGSASVAYDVADDDLVKRFMTTVSDSVLTVLNGNLWMLPGGFAIDKEERIDRFVAYARQLMPHVITLQEIWTKNQVTYLKRRFPEYHVFASGSGGPFNKAGLVTLTRIPSDSVAFSAFDIGKGASLGVNAIRKVKSLKGDRMLIPQALAWHFLLRSMLIREPVVSDHYMLAYRIKLQQRSLAQRSQEAL